MSAETDLIQLGAPYQAVDISSDHHLPMRHVGEIGRKMLASLGQGDLHPVDHDYQWVVDTLVPPEDGAERLSLWIGDPFHNAPSFRFERPLFRSAITVLTEAMVKVGTNGSHFRMIPGNHTRLSDWPDDVLNEWQQRGIIPENERFDITFPGVGLNFTAIHGQEAQPGYHSFPGGKNVLVQRLLERTTSAARKLGLLNPEHYPQFLVKRINDFMNRPQIRFAQRNFPGRFAVMGHTHFSEWNPEEQYFNTGFLNTLFYDITQLRLTPAEVSMSTVDLAACNGTINAINNSGEHRVLRHRISNTELALLNRS